jgi:HK97 gp10 family phage protein
MPYDFSLQITYKGVKGAQNALNQFPEDIDNVIKDKLEEIGMDVVTEMQQLVPVDTGALQDSIGYNISNTGELTFEATEEYAGAVEYGTSKMEAQPYFNPPLDRLRNMGIGDKFGDDALSNWNRLVTQHKNE